MTRKGRQPPITFTAVRITVHGGAACVLRADSPSYDGKAQPIVYENLVMLDRECRS